jgi:soluble lytic murein transglycosylase-like protein
VSGTLAGRARCESGQALVVMAGSALVLVFGLAVLGAFGRAMLDRGRHQRAADLAAISAARSMRDDFARLFEPARDARGRLNRRHLEKTAYLARATEAAVEIASANGADARSVQVSFPDGRSFAPLRVQVRLTGSAAIRLTSTGSRQDRIELRTSARAELVPPSRAPPRFSETQPTVASGGGYSGPLAYRQGKPMRPDVARAFDRLDAAARRAGLALIITSAYRSDAEQARLYARHPDPRWVAPPGKSLHRNGTELDLGPPAAYGWLAHNALRFGFLKRYSWEPWHFGYVGGSSAPVRDPVTADPAGHKSLPAFVPSRYANAIASAASRWNVPAELLAAQLFAESNFNPFARSPAGALGIAQFMPGTARSYGLHNPFDAASSIHAQAHLMHDLLVRFGSTALALAAYNAGPGAVQRYGGIPPYPETRAYVARILGLISGAGGAPSASPPALEVRLVS